MDGVLSVFPNRYHKLHTTKSWEFIGLPPTARRHVKTESNMVVGLLDTGSRIYFNIYLISSAWRFVITKDNNDVVLVGITPQSESFAENGLGPPPAKWKGTCGHYANFSGCNKFVHVFFILHSYHSIALINFKKMNQGQSTTPLSLMSIQSGHHK